ncbi:hypothetical protein [Streptomyces sp. SAS_260]|uniref:hypothetical protein n=1 Tax=Streptomyces sp. SAS_260 TaxID=3412751 RepID=UPI00403C7B66
MAVRDRGLSYDVRVRSNRICQAIRLAERFPDLPQVLDRAGKPSIASGELADREGQLRLLAVIPARGPGHDRPHPAHLTHLVHLRPKQPRRTPATPCTHVNPLLTIGVHTEGTLTSP